MTHEELLLELKDISPPVEPGWWLIAPGYMILLALIAVLFLVGWIAMRRHHSLRSYTAARLALRDIRGRQAKSENSLLIARELAQWLKQVALIAFPESRLEGMTGSDWLQFLDNSIDDDSFSQGVGAVFADAVYQRSAQPDTAQLISLCERWLLAVKPRLLRRGQG
ncbi:MAG: DUF4381 domain-containing protein [Gammaproteobacteria bacterium]|nr:DUF4381 domain-containing protein [Gammaproteobacteria bacterium]